MKKKILAVLLCICLVGVMAGCTSKEKPEEGTNKEGTNNEDTNKDDTNKDDANNDDSKFVGVDAFLLNPPEGSVELGNYKGIEVTMASTEVKEEEIQSGLEKFVTEQFVEVKDHTDVKDGDTVNINYEGKIDGVAFDGGSDTTEAGFNLEIGSGRFIPGFEEQLIGKKVGEKSDIKVTFPKDYGEEGTAKADLNGKEAVFTVTINKIVRAAVIGDLTDEFIVQFASEYKTIEEWKKGYSDKLKTQKESDAENQFRYDVVKAVIEGSKFTGLSDKDVKAVVDDTIAEYESYATSFGMEMEAFIGAFAGVSLDDFKTQVTDSANYSLKQLIIANKIIEVEKLTLSDEEYTAGLADIVAQGNAESPEALETQFGKEFITKNLLLTKALDVILDSAVKK